MIRSKTNHTSNTNPTIMFTLTFSSGRYDGRSFSVKTSFNLAEITKIINECVRKKEINNAFKNETRELNINIKSESFNGKIKKFIISIINISDTKITYLIYINDEIKLKDGFCKIEKSFNLEIDK
jgi:hypothetical protein